MVHKTADTLLVTIKLALRLPHFHRNFSFDRFFFLSRHVYETQTLSVCLCVCGKSNILPHSFTAAFHPPTPNTISQCYRTLARTNFVPFVFVFFFQFLIVFSHSGISKFSSQYVFLCHRHRCIDGHQSHCEPLLLLLLPPATRTQKKKMLEQIAHHRSDIEPVACHFSFPTLSSTLCSYALFIKHHRANPSNQYTLHIDVFSKHTKNKDIQ